MQKFNKNLIIILILFNLSILKYCKSKIYSKSLSLIKILAGSPPNLLACMPLSEIAVGPSFTLDPILVFIMYS